MEFELFSVCETDHMFSPPAPPCSLNMNNNIDFLIMNQPFLPGWFPLGHEKYFILIYHGIGFSI